MEQDDDMMMHIIPNIIWYFVIIQVFLSRMTKNLQTKVLLQMVDISQGFFSLVRLTGYFGNVILKVLIKLVGGLI